jgi:hypothetical protein
MRIAVTRKFRWPESTVGTVGDVSVWPEQLPPAPEKLVKLVSKVATGCFDAQRSG